MAAALRELTPFVHAAEAGNKFCNIALLRAAAGEGLCSWPPPSLLGCQLGWQLGKSVVCMSHSSWMVSPACSSRHGGNVGERRRMHQRNKREQEHFEVKEQLRWAVSPQQSHRRVAERQMGPDKMKTTKQISGATGELLCRE